MRVAQNRKIRNNLFINTDISEVSVRNFVLTFSDSYHSDPKYQKSIDIQVNIFLSEPPRFLNGLSNLTVNMWSVYYSDLPDAFDPENNTFTIKLILESYMEKEILGSRVCFKNFLFTIEKFAQYNNSTGYS